MWVKLVLLLLFCLMVLGAVHFAAPDESKSLESRRGESNSSANNDRSLRLLTWNIG
jgi:hypothetical protein